MEPFVLCALMCTRLKSLQFLNPNYMSKDQMSLRLLAAQAIKELLNHQIKNLAPCVSYEQLKVWRKSRAAVNKRIAHYKSLFKTDPRPTFAWFTIEDDIFYSIVYLN